jgi:hypothetical protein
MRRPNTRGYTHLHAVTRTYTQLHAALYPPAAADEARLQLRQGWSYEGGEQSASTACLRCTVGLWWASLQHRSQQPAERVMVVSA